MAVMSGHHDLVATEHAVRQGWSFLGQRLISHLTNPYTTGSSVDLASEYVVRLRTRLRAHTYFMHTYNYGTNTENELVHTYNYWLAM